MPRKKTATARSPKRQVNIEVTDLRYEILMLMARDTDSVSTNGVNKGEPSVGAFVRRIAEGHVSIVYQGRIIKIPPKLLFGV